MNINLDTQQMITFVTLVREQNFRRAAKVLQVSQPTVTIRMKMLEQCLGVELLQRRGTSIRLTPIGETVFQYVERMLYFIQEGKDHISRQPVARKRYVISAIPSFCTYVFPWMLGVDREAGNQVELTIHNSTSNDVLQSVLDGMAQFGVLRGPVNHPQLESLRLYRERIFLAFSPQHPLNELQEIHISDVVSERFITYPRRFWSYVRSRFLEHGGQLMTNIRVDTEVTAKTMVKSSLGLTFLPELSMRREGKKGTIVCRYVSDCDIYRDAYLIFPKGGDEEMVGQFYEWVQHSINEHQSHINLVG